MNVELAGGLTVGVGGGRVSDGVGGSLVAIRVGGGLVNVDVRGGMVGVDGDEVVGSSSGELCVQEVKRKVVMKRVSA